MSIGPGPKVIKLFMFISAEHEILMIMNIKIAIINKIFKLRYHQSQSFILLINVKMPSRSVITSGPGHTNQSLNCLLYPAVSS